MSPSLPCVNYIVSNSVVYDRTARMLFHAPTGKDRFRLYLYVIRDLVAKAPTDLGISQNNPPASVGDSNAKKDVFPGIVG